MVDPYAHLLDDYGQIRSDRIEDLLVEVVSGKYIWTESSAPHRLFASRCPTTAEQDAARVIYVRSLKLAQAKGCLTRAELDDLAIRDGLFIAGEREEKRAIITMLERQAKAKDNTSDERQKQQLTLEMEIGRRRVVEIETKEWQILQHSAEARADQQRSNYFVYCCTTGGELLDESLWPSWAAFMDAADWPIYLDARSSFQRVSIGLPTRIIRALARTMDWRVRWKSSKESGAPVFGDNAANWDRNKVNLIYWSDFYDSIYEHPECPEEETVQNDEYLQRWLNQQVINRKQQKANNPTNNRRSPTYVDGAGRRKVMTKLGGDKTIQVGTPYKIRV